MVALNEKLWPVALEYTRQMAELMGVNEWHWIGTDDDGKRPISVCDFGGTYFFTLEEMQVVIDRMEKWVKRYGNREAVAQEISDWFDWWLADVGDTPHPLEELVWNRMDRYMRFHPSINLENWLMGCPRERRKPDLNDRLRLLTCQRTMLMEMAEKYRGTRSLWNIYDNLNAEIKELEAQKKKQDEQMMEEFRQTDEYKEFAKILEENAEMKNEENEE